MTNKKILAILNNYLREDKKGKYYYLLDSDFGKVAFDIEALYQEQIAKRDEYEKALEELIKLCEAPQYHEIIRAKEIFRQRIEKLKGELK